MYYSSRSKRFLVAAVCCISSLVAFAGLLPDTLVAFPGAEGFGKYTSGGRGGKVVYVTTLADDANGETVGSLRWAIKQFPGEPLTVCFAVSGEIRLVDRLYFNRGSTLPLPVKRRQEWESLLLITKRSSEDRKTLLFVISVSALGMPM